MSTITGDHQDRVTDYTALAVESKGDNYAGTQNEIVRLLWQTYGEKNIIEWGTAILASLQQTEILQQGVYESSVQSETEKWKELDGNTPPSPTIVAGWLLRDMRKQQECGCSPQGRESTKQQPGQLATSMSELSYQNPQTCEEMFNMWSKGQRIWLLREALSEIQKIRESFNGERQSVYGDTVVRRLTPLEAERLQGYPDGWTDIGEWTDTKGKKHKDADSPRYRELGNSIALPFWEWMARRMAAYLPEGATMGSLFDGIGGFPLVFSRAGVKPVWASEIEEHPIAVTIARFGEKENEQD